MFTGRKLALTLAFTVLVAVALGVSCRGFFVNPTLQSIAVSPSTPQVSIGGQTTLSVYGTYSDGSRNVVNSGVSWSALPTGVVTIVGTGSATITGVATGTTTITAEAQALTSTASATVIGNVSSIVISPTSGTITVGQTPGQAFSFAATPGPPNYVTTGNGGTLNITPSDGFLSCIVSVDSNNNPNMVCSVGSTGGSSQYFLVMTYPSSTGGTVTSNTATLNVSGTGG
jgi:hypothetical protein